MKRSVRGHVPRGIALGVRRKERLRDVIWGDQYNASDTVPVSSTKTVCVTMLVADSTRRSNIVRSHFAPTTIRSGIIGVGW